ncbi:MAG: hypothetical protein MCSN_5990 [Candidatus Microsyncoccus archaeolyticus]|jgi:hypothetical protein|nr:MAG: hypothetical protein MCSN_5990 [Candidatus Parcubacteria bacterium]
MLVFVCLAAGCIKENSIPGKFEEYFPMNTNSEWHYVVENYGEPLSYEIIEWPYYGNSVEYYSTRGVSLKDPGIYSLKLKVSQKAETQSQITAEIEVLEDTFDLFDDIETMYWKELGRNSDYPIIIQEKVYPGYSSPLSSMYYFGQSGESDTVLLFKEDPGVVVVRVHGANKNPEDQSFQFIGPENYLGKECLHYTRTVNAGKGISGSSIGKGFTEDLWFARGTGLIRLEQRVDGKMTMTWTLSKFVPG